MAGHSTRRMIDTTAEDVQRLEEIRVAIRQGDRLKVEDESRKRLRARRISPDAPADISTAAAERIINTNELLPVGFLSRGAEVARSIVRIVEPKPLGPEAEGTGFTVSPRLLVTNNHVIPTPNRARTLAAQFGFEYHPWGGGAAEIHTFDPDAFFRTNEELDVTILALAEGEEPAEPPGVRFGFNQLIGAQGKAIIGEWLNVIQHPGGREKAVALRENRFIDRLDDMTIVYESDTDRGSSGAPVYNDQWEVVAIHRRSIPRRDSLNNTLTRTGAPATDSTPDEEIHWIANEGARVRAVVEWLQSEQWTVGEQELIDECLGSQGPE
jgi:endonuclease G